MGWLRYCRQVRLIMTNRRMLLQRLTDSGARGLVGCSLRHMLLLGWKVFLKNSIVPKLVIMLLSRYLCANGNTRTLVNVRSPSMHA
eukprot:4812212-Pyramimonas_sp.AAC.1